MANSLLDFVMSLVRDPDAAARYAADPAEAIADAELADVTSADVNNLIPMVAESLSMSTPMPGTETLGAEPAGNVWASGAATSAFDAFDEQLPTPGFDVTDDVPRIVTDLVDEPAEVGPASQFDELPDVPVVSDVAEMDVAEFGEDWHSVTPDVAEDLQPGDHGPGFDLFD